MWSRGREPWDEGGFFDGRIDELRVYDRALSTGEVAADMEAPIQTPKQGPVAAYSFDEGEGTTVEDVSGDGHTATIEGRSGRPTADTAARWNSTPKKATS